MDLIQDLIKEHCLVLIILYVTKYLFISNLFHSCSKRRNRNKRPTSVGQEEM